jgi:hypothetical protein
MTRALYVAVLNDDAFPEPGWLEALLKVMEADPEIGACASLMVFDHRPEIIQSAGIAIDRTAIAWDRLRGYPMAHAQAPAEVFGASAGAALYRCAMLEALGGFDERFFAYLEGVDLAWRAQIAGWRCVYVPSARVFGAGALPHQCQPGGGRSAPSLPAGAQQGLAGGQERAGSGFAPHLALRSVGSGLCPAAPGRSLGLEGSAGRPSGDQSVPGGAPPRIPSRGCPAGSALAGAPALGLPMKGGSPWDEACPSPAEASQPPPGPYQDESRRGRWAGSLRASCSIAEG